AGRRPVRGGCRPPAGGGPAVAPGPVRLTRRGRRLVAVLGVTGALGLGVLAAPVVADAVPSGPGMVLAGESRVVVRPGDTLWSIAVGHAPQDDPRAVVHAIQQLNDLDGAGLVPGQVLRLP
ncbi:LysM peptidoglycan-binding domain-containing protein, partial [Goekera deserti]